jgi:two-component system, OmpR family, response regulator AdeR
MDKKRILLVEDDTFVRDLYSNVLAKSGYEVVTAVDGEHALEIAKEGKYDLVLLDIMLPKLTGLEVLTTFKETHSDMKDVPVFLLTNLGDESITSEAYRLGAEGYLLKAKHLPKQVVEEVDNFFSQKVPQQ